MLTAREGRLSASSGSSSSDRKAVSALQLATATMKVCDGIETGKIFDVKTGQNAVILIRA
jgi:hypothetical protein